MGQAFKQARTPFLPGIPQLQNMMFIVPSGFVAGLAKNPYM